MFQKSQIYMPTGTQQSELSKAEQISGVRELMEKIAQHRPRITCFVGLGIADIVKSVLVCIPEHHCCLPHS